MAPGDPGRARHPAPVEAQAGDGTYPGAPRSGPHARATRGRRLHEPVPLCAPLSAQHRGAAASVRGAHADRSCRHAARRSGSCPSRGSRERWGSGPRAISPRCSAASPASRRERTGPGISRRHGPGVREMRHHGSRDVAERLRARCRHRASSPPPWGKRSGRGPGGAPPPARRGGARGTGWPPTAIASTGWPIRITGNSSDAEEVVQDALWAATRKIDTFLGTAAFGSWIYRITANAACQKRRKRRVERAEVAWDDLGPRSTSWGSTCSRASTGRRD